MALRVLLADESATIKKVFQLALQDFGVEVTSVNVGVDVLPLVQKSKPDIIFVDVLLQKKNGYEVTREIKQDPALRHIPVVLVWSGFMEVDKQKLSAAGADADLEKPFDTERLRDVIKTLVPKTQSQTLSKFLKFPRLPDFIEGVPPKKSSSAIPMPPAPPAAPIITPAPPPSEPMLDLGMGASTLVPNLDETAPGEAVMQEAETPTNWNMDSFEPLPSVEPTDAIDTPAAEEDVADDFLQIDLPPPQPTKERVSQRAAPPIPDEADDGVWVQKTLTNFKLPPEKARETKPEVKYSIPEEKIDPDTLITNAGWIRSGTASSITQAPVEKEKPMADEDALELDLGPSEESTAGSRREVTGVHAAASTASAEAISPTQLEKVIREQAQEMIEKVIWQVVPEIAARILERELEKLLKEREKL